MSGEQILGVGSGPIGERVAWWRRRRGLNRAQLAALTGLTEQELTAVESGHDWVDRRRKLAALATALRVEPGQLTGQPFAPAGPEQARVRAAGFELRRVLTGAARVPSARPAATDPAELAAALARMRQADADGDDLALATTLPGLLQDLEALLDGSSEIGFPTGPARGTLPTGRDAPGAPDPGPSPDPGPDPDHDHDHDHDVHRIRQDARVLASGLLRRLGYPDLAWLAVYPQRGKLPAPGALVEQVRLLIELGQPDAALARADRDPTGAPGPASGGPDAQPGAEGGLRPASTDAAAAADVATTGAPAAAGTGGAVDGPAAADGPAGSDAGVRVGAVGAGELTAAIALGLAMLDRAAEADAELQAVAAGIGSADSVARLAVASVLVAAECGAWDEVEARSRAVPRLGLSRADRAELLLAVARAELRRGAMGRAASALRSAEEAAPWRVWLDPFARELLVVLLRSGREADAGTAAIVHDIAERAGIGWAGREVAN